jgi:Spy/CpxP family protein refolding chaperone
MTTKLFTFATASAIACTLALSPAWADPEGGYGGHGGGYGKGGHAMGTAMMEMMMHGGAGHLIRHLLKHEKEIGLNPDQVSKLKEMQLNLDKQRIKMEADIMIAERELRALVEEEKTEMGAIESKLKQSVETQVALRSLSIKTRRDALAVLTPEQREKQKAEHEKAMQQHKSMGKGGSYGSGPHGSNPHGGPSGPNPHGANPHGQSAPKQ